MKLEARQLVKAYKGRRVVDGVDLHVHKGEIVGLLGANGAGKTTTFYMVVGFVRPNKGQVLLDGKDITRLPMYQRARRGLGYLAQETSVFRRLSVEDNLRLILELRVRGRKKRQEIIDRLLEEFHLSHLRRSRGDTLSGGERRRLEIARALSVEPHFLLLDEPFTGVDPRSIEDIQEIIRGLRNRGLGILLTDHSVRETLAITDRTYLMEKGHIIEHGTPHEIASSELAREKYLGRKFTLAGLDLPGGPEEEEEDPLIAPTPALWRQKGLAPHEDVPPEAPLPELPGAIFEAMVEENEAYDETLEGAANGEPPPMARLSQTLDDIQADLEKTLPPRPPADPPED